MYAFENINMCHYATYVLYSDLKLGDTFVGYQEDTTASVVFQAYHNLQERESNSEISEDSMKEQVTLQYKSL